MRRPGLLLAAESLALPAGLVLGVLLTRTLGPRDFGLLALSVSLVAWTEAVLLAFLGRATVRLLATSPGAEQGLLRLTTRLGGAAWLALALLGLPAAWLTGQPRLAWTLALLGLEIPLFLLANLHKSILVARRRDRARAAATATRWLGRLLLVSLLLPLGVAGALTGMVLAAALELLVARTAPQPGEPVKLGPALRYVSPWVAATASLALVETMGIWVLAANPTASGWYGAAQGATRAGYVVLTLLPVLHAEIAAALHSGQGVRARGLARRALALLFLTLPVAALVAWSAPWLVGLLYGPEFAPSAGLLAWLVFGGCGYVMLDTVHTVLGASGRSRLTLVLTAPLVPLALLGHALAVPVYGAAGAAMVTALTLLAGALTGMLVVLGTDLAPAERAVPPSLPAQRPSAGRGDPP